MMTDGYLDDSDGDSGGDAEEFVGGGEACSSGSDECGCGSMCAGNESVSGGV